MTPTTASRLAAAAAIALLVAAVAVRVLGTGRGALPLPGALLPLVVAVVELSLARSLRARLAGRPGTRAVLPMAVARVAALGQASSLTGALAAGAWVALLLDRLLRLGLSRAVRVDAVVAAVGVVCAGALVGAALRVEAVCRVRSPPDSGRR